MSKIEGDPALRAKLAVDDGRGCHTAFVDVGVYTRNRNFRLWLSSKLHKNVPLVTSRRNRYKNPTQEGMWLTSLVCHVPASAQGTLLRISSATYGAAARDGAGGGGGRQPVSPASQEGYQGSLFPDLDAFILAVASARGARPAKIRRWCYFERSKVLTYEMSSNRWCENVGREHKSNGVYYVANIEQGVFYQKCHDPDCSSVDFRSDLRRIPDTLLPDDPAGDGNGDDDWEAWMAAAGTEQTLDEMAAGAGAAGLVCTQAGGGGPSDSDGGLSDSELDALVQQHPQLSRAVNGAQPSSATSEGVAAEGHGCKAIDDGMTGADLHLANVSTRVNKNA